MSLTDEVKKAREAWSSGIPVKSKGMGKLPERRLYQPDKRMSEAIQRAHEWHTAIKSLKE